VEAVLGGGTGGVDLHINPQLTRLRLLGRQRGAALLQRIGLLGGIHGLDRPQIRYLLCQLAAFIRLQLPDEMPVYIAREVRGFI